MDSFKWGKWVICVATPSDKGLINSIRVDNKNRLYWLPQSFKIINVNYRNCFGAHKQIHQTNIAIEIHLHMQARLSATLRWYDIIAVPLIQYKCSIKRHLSYPNDSVYSEIVTNEFILFNIAIESNAETPYPMCVSCVYLYLCLYFSISLSNQWMKMNERGTVKPKRCSWGLQFFK